jgi:hypothetical protein
MIDGSIGPLARRGALQTMRWTDLHLDDRVWLVPATWSKNRRELAVALPTKAVDILRARQAEATSQWVWPSETAKDGHVVEPRKALAGLLKAAGVETRITMHDHTSPRAAPAGTTPARAHPAPDPHHDKRIVGEAIAVIVHARVFAICSLGSRSEAWSGIDRG